MRGIRCARSPHEQRNCKRGNESTGKVALSGALKPGRDLAFVLGKYSNSERTQQNGAHERKHRAHPSTSSFKARSTSCLPACRSGSSLAERIVSPNDKHIAVPKASVPNYLMVRRVLPTS